MLFKSYVDHSYYAFLWLCKVCRTTFRKLNTHTNFLSNVLPYHNLLIGINIFLLQRYTCPVRSLQKNAKDISYIKYNLYWKQLFNMKIWLVFSLVIWSWFNSFPIICILKLLTRLVAIPYYLCIICFIINESIQLILMITTFITFFREIENRLYKI